MTHDELREALALYALRSLDSASDAEVAVHVRDCTECQRALAENRQTLDAIGRGVEQVRPRDELRARVLGAVKQTAPRASGPVVAGPPAPVAIARAPKWQWAALAAAAAIAIATSAGFVAARREVQQLREELREWQSRVAQAEQRFANAAGELSSQRRIVAVLTSTDIVQTTLNGVDPATGARGRAFVSPSQRTVVFRAEGLPPLPSGRSYQVWAIVGSAAVSAGVFAPDANGQGELVATDVQGLTAAPAAIAVTLEPLGGVPQPTGPKYLVGLAGN